MEERVRSVTSILRSRVRGVGAALPARVVTNAELAGKLETSDEWIRQRTGITQRYIASDGETTASLAARAAEAALRHAGLEPSAIDLVVVATSTPDLRSPGRDPGPGEPRHRRGRGVRPASGLHRLRLCGRDRRQVLRSGSNKRALVIGAETFSRILDWSDRTTCVLFGDGAGAIVLEATESDGGLAAPGVITSRLGPTGATARSSTSTAAPRRR